MLAFRGNSHTPPQTTTTFSKITQQDDNPNPTVNPFPPLAQLRNKGSIHSDVWTGTAVDLARCGVLAVYPVSGWWRERKHLRCWDRQARYALIVTIETPETDVYTSIANQIAVPTPVEIETN